MLVLFIQAYWALIRCDLHLAQRDFAGLHGRVRNSPVNNKESSTDAMEKVCAAVDRACIWYWKEALCLQRSAATALLLKRHGVSAQMVIGIQDMPFRAHAWVEVDGFVVNDRPYVREVYSPLDQC